MKKVDTLIVGFGLAGLAYAETLRQNRRSFHIIDQAEGGSSVIAAGIYNPTVLKRFNMTWFGAALHAFALPFYGEIEEYLESKFIFPFPIFKLFAQAADHNSWTVAADREGLSYFLDPVIQKAPLEGVTSSSGYGLVKHCGRLDTLAMIKAYTTKISSHITLSSFDYSQLKIFPNHIDYGDIAAKRIVFCEGYAMVNNPFFNNLPIVGSKGQILIIQAPELQQEAILKGPIFIAPLGGSKFWAGASFEQQDKTLSVTIDGAKWLQSKIDRMIHVPYTIVEQVTHIRPTVIDRRPLLGTHPLYSNLHLFNGMGSRGVLTAPKASNWLFNHIDGQKDLPKEVNINRFEKTS